MSEPTLATIKAAHMTIYEAHIDFDWEYHPHLTEAEAEQVQKVIDVLQAEHKARADFFETTNPNKKASQ